MIYVDTHAWTGTDTDYIDNSNTYVSMPHFTAFSGNTEYRNSKDLVCTPRGKELIDLCFASYLYILNGRTFGDILGKYTCFLYNGNSVIDYCMVSESLFRKNILSCSRCQTTFK